MPEQSLFKKLLYKSRTFTINIANRTVDHIAGSTSPIGNLYREILPKTSLLLTKFVNNKDIIKDTIEINSIIELPTKTKLQAVQEITDACAAYSKLPHLNDRSSKIATIGKMHEFRLIYSYALNRNIIIYRIRLVDGQSQFTLHSLPVELLTGPEKICAISADNDYLAVFTQNNSKPGYKVYCCLDHLPDIKIPQKWTDCWGKLWRNNCEYRIANVGVLGYQSSYFTPNYPDSNGAHSIGAGCTSLPVIEQSPCLEKLSFYEKKQFFYQYPHSNEARIIQIHDPWLREHYKICTPLNGMVPALSVNMSEGCLVIIGPSGEVYTLKNANFDQRGMNPNIIAYNFGQGHGRKLPIADWKHHQFNFSPESEHFESIAITGNISIIPNTVHSDHLIQLDAVIFKDNNKLCKQVILEKLISQDYWSIKLNSTNDIRFNHIDHNSIEIKCSDDTYQQTCEINSTLGDAVPYYFAPNQFFGVLNEKDLTSSFFKNIAICINPYHHYGIISATTLDGTPIDMILHAVDGVHINSTINQDGMTWTLRGTLAFEIKNYEILKSLQDISPFIRYLLKTFKNNSFLRLSGANKVRYKLNDDYQFCSIKIPNIFDTQSKYIEINLHQSPKTLWNHRDLNQILSEQETMHPRPALN